MWTTAEIIVNAALERSGLTDISGATAGEYALIGTGISVAIIAALFSISNETNRLFEIIQAALSGSGI
ncbi:MAG: Flp family type IVb pilin [Proteobacteria bacterium]|nr:Flp family type IVb pilin [Pseudomonadota bacterium]